MNCPFKRTGVDRNIRNVLFDWDEVSQVDRTDDEVSEIVDGFLAVLSAEDRRLEER